MVLKTDKNGNRTEIKREQNGITHPVVRTGDGNFFVMPTVHMPSLHGRSSAFLHVCILVMYVCIFDCCLFISGVTGVGKEKTLQFIRACKSHDKSCDLLDMFRQWRTGTINEGLSE